MLDDFNIFVHFNRTFADQLSLENNRLTDVKGIEKLTQLTWLDLRGNPNLTKAQIDQLQKALPRCDIQSKPKMSLIACAFSS